MNTKRTGRHMLNSKTIWKSTNQVAEIAKKIKKNNKTLEHKKTTKKRTIYIKTSGEQSSGPYTLQTRENVPVG